MLFLYLVLFFLLLIYYFTKTRRALHMLQLNHYNENQRYLKWVMKHPKQAFYHLDLGGVILLLLPFVTNEYYFDRHDWILFVRRIYAFIVGKNGSKQNTACDDKSH